jgi:hypothetical protein
MKTRLLALAAVMAVSAGVAGTTPAAAATPGAPIAKAIAFKAAVPGNGVVQVFYRPGRARYCRYLRHRARFSWRARRLYRRYCRGYHHVSYRVCRRWFYLGYRLGIPRYRHLYRRYCRWYR